MHIVIADDLTGAAEIAGVGLSRGLKGVISTRINPDENGDLLCLATDTRSQARQDTSKCIIDYTRELKKYEPKIIYKKIDSALRGNVMLECDAFARALDLDRVLIIPANPSLKRIVKNGTYFINDVPIAQVEFLRGKNKSSKLLDLINPDYRDRTKVIKEPSELNAPGYYIGEVERYEDLLKWASLSDGTVALCGGSDFFDALLQFHGHNIVPEQPEDLPFGERQLFVLGSAALKNAYPVNHVANEGFTISNMPWKIFTNAGFSTEEIDKWIKEILLIYQSSSKLVVTMNYEHLPFEERPHLKLALGELISSLMKQIEIDELFVEGGATSYAILKKLEDDHLVPVQNLARGVTRMQLSRYKSLKMTVKPGSYLWPEAVWPQVKKMILK